jgi:hypothetical protein
MNLALHRWSQDRGSQVPCPILDPKVQSLLQFFGLKEDVHGLRSFTHGLKLGSDTGRSLSKSFKIEQTKTQDFNRRVS